MQLRTTRVSSLIAIAAVAGLAGRAFGQYTIAGQFSYPGAPGYVGTDDTSPGNGGNTVDYSLQLLQSYGAPAQAVVNTAYVQGANSPYIIGVGQYKVQTGSGPVYGPSYTTGSTAFYYSPTTGFNYFGQAAPGSTAQYVDTGATTNWSTGSATSTFTSTDSHFISLSGENTAGVAIGAEGINVGNSNSNGVLGTNAFAFNIPTNTATTLGLNTLGGGVSASGASYTVNYNYSNNTSGISQGTYSSSTPYSIDSSGNISGQTNRYYNYGGAYTSTLQSLGTSTWYYNGTSTVETGLYGAGYSYNKSISALAGQPSTAGVGTYASNIDHGVNGAYEVGVVTPYVDTLNSSGLSLGADVWEYNANTTTTTPLGLYASGNTPNVAGFGTSYNGTPFSYSYLTTSNVSGSIYSGNDRSSSVVTLNSAGQVAGTSSYYAGSSSSKGTDAWVYTPGSGYQQVGLLSNGFNGLSFVTPTSSFVSSTGQRSSIVRWMNSQGATVGTSTEYLSANTNGTSASTTTVAWFTPPNSSATVLIGPEDPYHTAYSATLGSYVNEGVTTITDGGWIAGTATRYTPGTTTTNGTDAWVQNALNGTLYILDPNPNSTANFTSVITYLSPNGVAVGEYEAGTSYYSAFIWSSAIGFEDLTSTTFPSINSVSGANVNTLTDAYSYDPTTGDIFTTAQYVSGGAAVSPPDFGVAVLSGPPVPVAVPEPASLALLGGIAAAGLLRRRRSGAR